VCAQDDHAHHRHAQHQQERANSHERVHHLVERRGKVEMRPLPLRAHRDDIGHLAHHRGRHHARDAPHQARLAPGLRQPRLDQGQRGKEHDKGQRELRRFRPGRLTLHHAGLAHRPDRTDRKKRDRHRRQHREPPRGRPHHHRRRHAAALAHSGARSVPSATSARITPTGPNRNVAPRIGACTSRPIPAPSIRAASHAPTIMSKAR